MAYQLVSTSPAEDAAVSRRSRLSMAVYEMSTSVGSIFKKIRSSFNENFDSAVEDLWWFFHAVPPYFLLVAFDYFVATPLDLNMGICLIFALVGTAIQAVLFYSVIYWNKYTPFQLMGAQGKFMIEFIPALTLAAWHQVLLFKLGGLSLLQILNDEYGPICLFLACTMYFYLLAHFLHRAYDVTAKDVIVGLTMQVFCFMVCGELFIRLLILFFCFSLSFYRYTTYAAPDVIPHPKRESGELPI